MKWEHRKVLLNPFYESYCTALIEIERSHEPKAT